MKVTVIGVGNIGGAIARGLAKGSILKASDITCTDLVQENLDKMLQANNSFIISKNNLEAVKNADIVIIAVKPWRVESVISEIKYALNYENQIIISIAAGIPFDRLNEFLDKDPRPESTNTPALFRVIPNIAIEVCSSMTFVSSCNATHEQEVLVVNLFNELGSAMLIEENLMTAGTALASSGIAFAMRYIRASSEGGVELGFYPDQAKEIVLKTVKGAVDLLLANKSNPETEIDKVTTPGGITIRGLNEMELAGFTPSVIRGLKASK
ncbi:MAG: pyrroline-5-carboxylate reductase [Macellibacteroides sp.]|jgi:pyrroline-5-carboxylate reductase|uniref:pyrroline-5-carboxylate reductase n=1 Tax=Macellibacteroides sp. TaxID=2014584 RepID=UPI003E78CF28